jgi:hypothetical protein
MITVQTLHDAKLHMCVAMLLQWAAGFYHCIIHVAYIDGNVHAASASPEPCHSLLCMLGAVIIFTAQLPLLPLLPAPLHLALLLLLRHTPLLLR